MILQVLDVAMTSVNLSLIWGGGLDISLDRPGQLAEEEKDNKLSWYLTDFSEMLYFLSISTSWSCLSLGKLQINNTDR